MTIAPSPIVQINRMVAYSFRHGPRAGLSQLEIFESEPSMQRYHLFHAVKGDLLRRLHRNGEARECFARALELTENAREQEFLKSRIESMG
jgi:predicted RNA polymerase sigma factor